MPRAYCLDKSAEPDPQLHAQPHELVGPHYALAVEDAPKAFPIDAYAARELGDGDTSLPARLLHPGSYEVDVLHGASFRRRAQRAPLIRASPFYQSLFYLFYLFYMY